MAFSAFSDSFRTARWVRTSNLVLQAVLFLTFFSGVNYVARHHPSRFDLTRHRNFSLSPETLSYVKNLTRPVHAVATFSDDSEMPPEVRGLLDEYTHATESSPGKITREYLNVYENRRRAEELGIDQANLIVLVSGDRRRVVTLDELYRVKDKQREAFQGE